MGKPLLDLDTLVVRPTIAIDGQAHEILAPDELPVLTTHLLASKGRRMDELMKSAELGAAEQAELGRLVREISDAIMAPVPAKVREKLSETQRVSVIEAFAALLLTKKAGTAAALFGSLLPETDTPAKKPDKKNATGAKRSRGSSASTAARRGGGSAKPRSRS